MSDEWPPGVRGPKPPPSDHAKCLHFWTRIPRRSMYPNTPAQNTDYLTFSLLPITSPHLRPPYFFIQGISQGPHLRGDRSDICSPVSSLGCLVNKLFLCYKLQHLSVWLAACWANKPGSVTEPHASRILQYLSFCDWLISLKTMSSRFTHVVACVRIHFFLRLNIHIHTHTPFCLSIHLLVNNWVTSTQKRVISKK